MGHTEFDVERAVMQRHQPADMEKERAQEQWVNDARLNILRDETGQGVLFPLKFFGPGYQVCRARALLAVVQSGIYALAVLTFAVAIGFCLFQSRQFFFDRGLFFTVCAYVIAQLGARGLMACQTAWLARGLPKYPMRATLRAVVLRDAHLPLSGQFYFRAVFWTTWLVATWVRRSADILQGLLELLWLHMFLTDVCWPIYLRWVDRRVRQHAAGVAPVLWPWVVVITGVAFWCGDWLKLMLRQGGGA